MRDFALTCKEKVLSRRVRDSPGKYDVVARTLVCVGYEFVKRHILKYVLRVLDDFYFVVG